MRHGNAFGKFQKSRSHQRAMFRNMATSLFLNERCETTVQKAKELQRIAEKLITLGRKDTLASRRIALTYIMDKGVVHKLFTDIGPRFKSRAGGYTRVVRTRHRHGDAAELAMISLLAADEAPKKAKKTEKKTASKKSEAKTEAKEA
ncbi:MAG: 50S ribosomal protein L17 [Deltaproteobacteria bacterium]|nr:50S ribosomal protein L17 [Deltaproteobacteria bacterium]